MHKQKNRWHWAVPRRVLAALVVVATFAPAMVHAHDAAEEQVTPLMKQDIPRNAGDQVLLATVTFAPGQQSQPHMHAGPIVAYVLQGHITSQLNGGEIKTYGPGESWFEAPGTHHTMANNASKTEEARLLVFAIIDGAAPIKQALPAQ